MIKRKNKLNNKKQLAESIMEGVRRSFISNKALNEGFAQWKQDRLPKFDKDGFYKYVVNNLIKIVANLMNDQEITGVIFLYKPEIGNKQQWGVNNQNTVKAGLSYEDNLRTTFMTMYDDIDKAAGNNISKFIDAIQHTYVYIYTPEESEFGQYLIENIDTANNNKIKDKTYLKVSRDDAHHKVLICTLYDLEQNFNEFVDFIN